MRPSSVHTTMLVSSPHLFPIICCRFRHELHRPGLWSLHFAVIGGAGTVPGAAFAKHPEDAAEAAACMPVQCFGIPNDRRRGGVVGLYTTIMQRSFATKWLRQV